MAGRPTRVHETAFVGPGVELGVGVVVAPFAVLLGPTRILDHVRIGPGAHVGGAPEISTVRQNDPWDGDLDHHEIVVGEHTVLRDGVVIHHGSVRPTTVGARCSIFTHAYLAHDVAVGDDVTLSAGVRLGGHVTVRSGANLGLNVSVHQRRHVGAVAMVGMGTPVTHDVPPFATAYGTPARVRGINRFGLERFAVPVGEIEAVERAFEGGLGPYSREPSSGEPDAVDGVGAGRVRDELAWWAGLQGVRPMPLEPRRR